MAWAYRGLVLASVFFLFVTEAMAASLNLSPEPGEVRTTHLFVPRAGHDDHSLEAVGEGIDNLNYATITSVELQEAYVEGREARVIVRGVFPTCDMRLVSPVSIQRVDDVFVVLPKLEKRPGEECPTLQKNFRVRLSLGVLPEGSYGLHIRSGGEPAVEAAINVLKP